MLALLFEESVPMFLAIFRFLKTYRILMQNIRMSSENKRKEPRSGMEP